MKTGHVVGRVWATKRLSELPSGALLEIDLEDTTGKGAAERLVAFDPLGCGEGERVLVTQGSVAKGWFKDSNVVIDALVIGSLDVTGEEKPAGPKGRGKKS
jgi:ethanolamine utilization protein EutN